MPDSLKYAELPAERTPAGCVVTLHGRGVDGEDLIPLAAMLNLPSIRFIFPHAPFLTDFGGRAWYPPPPKEDEGILTSRKLLVELILKIETEEIPAERIALMGFSQGAVMSLDVGLRYPRRLAAIAALSGYLHDPQRIAQEKGAISQLPIFLAHGSADAVLPVSGSRRALEILEPLGPSVTYREYPIGHQIDPEEIDDIRAFLERCFPRS